MADKGLLRLLALAGMLLLSPLHPSAKPVGRGVKTVTQRGKSCTRQSGDERVSGRRTYLNLEVKLGEAGSFEVTRAAELPGSVRLNSAPTSDYIYEVSNGGQTVAVAFLRDDPFIARGFDDPSFSRGEKIERRKTVTVILNVPAFALSMLERCKLGLRLYRLQPGVKVEAIDAEAFLRLREEGHLTLILSVTAAKFTEAIKRTAKARG